MSAPVLLTVIAAILFYGGLFIPSASALLILCSVIAAGFAGFLALLNTGPRPRS